MEFDGDNTFPGCERCGSCCQIGALCMTADDYFRILEYLDTHDVAPRDCGNARCCFQNDDGTCMIWEARPQVCRLHNCHIPRKEILKMDPSIVVDENLWLVNLRQAFVLDRLPQGNGGA